MFNGLIREIAKVKKFENNRLILNSKYIPKIGDSVAVNGACLTATKIHSDGFEVELSPETQKRVAIENYRDEVHIEPAMKLGDKIDGHLIQGHIDCVGEILEIKKNRNSHEVVIKIPIQFMKFVVPKGSIAVDGVSLTINEVWGDRFRLTIIPHTFENTLFKKYRPHRKVNIETDMFAKYLYNFLQKREENSLNREIASWW